MKKQPYPIIYSAHYRSTKDGKLIYVATYVKQPETKTQSPPAGDDRGRRLRRTA